jgi:TRAP-type C4-dicarboxylate transport system permease small subunit
VGGTAEALAQAVSHLPEIGPFLLGGFPVLLLVAGLAFLVRHGRPFTVLCRLLDHVLLGLIVGSLFAILGLSALQIVLRNLLGTGFLWIDPLTRHLLLLMALSGMVRAVAGKRHIRIDAATRLLSARAARGVGTGIALLAGWISLALTHASLSLLGDELLFSELLFLDIPSWVVVALFPAAFLPLALRFLFLAFQEMAGEASTAPSVGEKANAEAGS